MSKSSGEFLTLQALVDRGFHPLAYRMMCLQAHYRSELEFSWESLLAASVRLKRWIVYLEGLRALEPSWHESVVSAMNEDGWQTDAAAFQSDSSWLRIAYKRIDDAASDDLGTPGLMSMFDATLRSDMPAQDKLEFVARTDRLLGLDLATLTRTELRVRPAAAVVDEADVEARLVERKEARVAKDFARSDAIRDELAAVGVEVMDGDPLGWDWKVAV